MVDVKEAPKLPGPLAERVKAKIGDQIRDKIDFKLPDQPKARREILDRFGPKVLNHVMRNLKSMLSLRVERGAELAARKKMAEAVRQKAGAGREMPASLVMKGGKALPVATPAADRPAPAERSAAGSLPMAGQPSPEAAQKELSMFEKVFLARFEGGEPLGERLEPGRQQFLAKTQEGWRGFFQKFLPFTMPKRANVQDLQAVVYRGVVQAEKGGAKETARGTAGSGASESGAGEAARASMMVSDLKFSARTDRFARVEIPTSTLLARVASMMPGEVLEKTLVAEWIASMGGSEIPYLALSHKLVQPDLIRAIANPAVDSAAARAEAEGAAVGREPERGIALTARAEQMAAEQLEIDWRPSGSRDLAADRADGKTGAIGGEKGMSRAGGWLAGLGKGRRRKGHFGGMWGEGGEAGGGVFVPWYQQILRFQKHPGRPKWYVPLIYFVVFSTFVLGAFYIFKFLLQR